MTRKRQQINFLWKITGWIFKGIFLGIWYLLKGIWWLISKSIKGIYNVTSRIWWLISKLISSLYRVTSRKIKESSEKRKLRSSPTYGKRAMFDPLQVLEAISGDYQVSEKRIHEDSIISLIFGKRGSGKSALGFRLLENIHHKTGRKCFVLGVSQENMPEWISTIENIEDAPQGSALLVDEGAISFGSRDSMSKTNKGLAGILAIARHKNLTVLFITQNTGMIDKNVLKLSDMLLVKQGSLLQLEMERPEIKKLYEKADSAFKKLEGDKRGFVYLIDSDFEGAVSHSLPSFWTESLSKNQAKDKE